MPENPYKGPLAPLPRFGYSEGWKGGSSPAHRHLPIRPPEDDTIPCPGPGCTKRVPSDKLGCLSHWNQVPWKLKQRVWDTWRARKAQPRDRALIKAHQEAKEAAIAAMQ